MIKVVAPNTALAVVDRAVQMYGAAGLTEDTPLSSFYISARYVEIPFSNKDISDPSALPMVLMKFIWRQSPSRNFLVASKAKSINVFIDQEIVFYIARFCWEIPRRERFQRYSVIRDVTM